MIDIGEPESGADLIVPTGTIDTTQGYGDRITVQDYEHTASQDRTYDVCALKDHSAVLLFDKGNFVYKKDLVDPTDPAVGNNGTVIVAGYTEGGYQDGTHLFKAWNSKGDELLTTELRSLTDQTAIAPNGQFAALQTEEVFDEYRSSKTPEDAYDFSIYLIDLEHGQILGRYTEQIPGIETGGGSRNKQIWDLEFVMDGSTPLLALYEARGRGRGSNSVRSRDSVPDDVPLIDMRGDLVRSGRPDISKHPDHYYLTAEAKEQLEE